MESEMTINAYGHKVWRNINGQVHREDGPAVIRTEGTEIWYIMNSRHREDGPAFIEPNGVKIWYKMGNLHREDGPAVENYNGNPKWFLEGLEYTKKEYNEKMRKKKISDLLE